MNRFEIDSDGSAVVTADPSYRLKKQKAVFLSLDYCDTMRREGSVKDVFSGQINDFYKGKRDRYEKNRRIRFSGGWQPYCR